MNHRLDALLSDFSHKLADELLGTLRIGIEPYWLLQSNDPPAETRMPNSLGCTGRYHDVAAQAWLEARGEWRGRAPAISLNDVEIFQRAIQQLAGVALHELAHVLAGGIGTSPPTSIERLHAASVVSYSVSLQADAARPPWIDHQAPFIRAALHARYHAMRHGIYTRIDDVFDPELYGLCSPASTYWHTLCPEMEQRFDAQALDAGKSLWTLQETPPPAEFVALWRADIESWAGSQPELSDFARHEVQRALAYPTHGEIA